MVNYNMKLAAALRLRHAAHVALVQTGGDTWLVARDGRGGRAHDCRAPLVRLLQSDPRACRGRVVFTSHIPNHAEKGMARVCGVRTVGYLQGPTERWHDMRRSGYGDTPQTGTTLGYRDWFNRPQLQRGNIERWLQTQNISYTWAEERAGRVGAGAARGDEIELIRRLSDPRTGALDQAARDTVGALLAFAVLESGRGPGGGRLRRSGGLGRSVGCVLVDGVGRLIAWGIDAGVGNPTLHGEVNLVQFFQSGTAGALLPTGGTLYTTLEPCEMCAGVLHVTTAGNFRVICGQSDPNLGWTALRNGSKGGMVRPARGPIVTGVTWADLLAARLDGGSTGVTRDLDPAVAETLAGEAHGLLYTLAGHHAAGSALRAWRETLAGFLDRVREGAGG